MMKIVENLWAVGAPRTPLGNSQRSPILLVGGEGVAAPSQEPHPALGFRLFGVGPPNEKSSTCPWLSDAAESNCSRRKMK